MAGYAGDPPAETGSDLGNPPNSNSQNTLTKIKERVKSISYSASDNKLLLDVEAATTEGSVKTSAVGDLEIANTGKHPAIAILAYRLWTAEGTMSGNTYQVHHLLKPGQRMHIPDCPAIIVDQDNDHYDGTAVSNAIPNSAEYVAIGSYMDGAIDDSASTTTIPVDDNNGGSSVATTGFFRIGDLIRIDNEIMEVTGVAENTGTEANLTVIRAVHGSTIASHSDNAQINLPFYNIYGGDYDYYSTTQTDGGGRFHAKNFFGAGRSNTDLAGITPGSVAIKFYEPGYQNLTNYGNITPSTNTGLSASTTYYLSVSIDGGTTDAITFTTDSSNVNFGGVNGVMSKLQSAIDALYYDPDKHNYNKKAIVSLVDGDMRITSGQRTSGSAISVTQNTAGTAETDELFDGQDDGTGDIGRFKAVIPTAVAAKLPDDVIYDRVTYISSPNDVFITDDGYGNLSGLGASGTINYETGEIDFQNAPANAEFVYTCLHTSPFSGRSSATNTAKMNTLKAVYGNMPNQKTSGELTITRR